MDLNEKIAYLRKEKGLTQKQVCEDLKISRQTLSKWENGVVTPSEDNIKRLIDYYEVSDNYFEEDEIVVEVKQEIKKKIPKWMIQLLVVVGLVAGLSRFLFTYPKLDVHDLDFNNIGKFKSAELVKADDEEIVIQCKFSIDEGKYLYYSVNFGSEDNAIIYFEPVGMKRTIRFTIPQDKIPPNRDTFIFSICIRDDTDSYIVHGGMVLIDISEYITG